MFEKQDYMLLDMEWEKAKRQGKTSFEVSVIAFDNVPNYQQHIQRWAVSHGFNYQIGIDVKFRKY